MHTPLRIAVVMGRYPAAERQRRVALIRSYARPDLEVGVIEVEPTPYVSGFSGSEAAAVPQFAEGCALARSQGYHAATPLGVLDIGVDEGRRAAGIPVVGAFEAAIHTAALLGRRIGVVAYTEGVNASLRLLAERYRVEPLIAGYGDVGIELPDFLARQDELEDAFCAAADALRTRHRADVIVSAGISLCPVHLERDALQARIGLPVVEPIAAPIALAAALLRQGLGTRPAPASL